MSPMYIILPVSCYLVLLEPETPSGTKAFETRLHRYVGVITSSSNYDWVWLFSVYIVDWIGGAIHPQVQNTSTFCV